MHYIINANYQNKNYDDITRFLIIMIEQLISDNICISLLD